LGRAVTRNPPSAALPVTRVRKLTNSAEAKPLDWFEKRSLGLDPAGATGAPTAAAAKGRPGTPRAVEVAVTAWAGSHRG